MYFRIIKRIDDRMIYTGVVENRYDPLKLGRCQVRIIGLHTHDKQKLSTEDLPWAYPMQSITSAAMSGIGSTPLGLVEGTSVLVVFQDADLQYPIIIGSLGGIPQSANNISVDDSTLILKIDGELKESNAQSNIVVDSSGNPVVSSDGTPITTTEPAPTLENTNSLKRAIEFTPSARCISLIKQFEGLRLQSYQDSVGIWTIGYGTTKINGQSLTSGVNITIAQAEAYLLADLNADAAASVKRNTRALITQSMFDALCCFVYNVGSGRYANSTLLKDLNASKYLDAASGFLQYDKATISGVLTALPGLTKRRSAEKDLFLSDGIPNSAGELPPSNQNDIKLDLIKSEPLIALKVPDPIPELPAQDGDLGNGTYVETNKNGTKSYSGGFGKYTYNASGKAIKYEPPTFGGVSASIDLTNNQQTLIYNSGPLSITQSIDSDGKVISATMTTIIGTETVTKTVTGTTVSAIQSTASTNGFGDPNGVYPLYIDEPDTNRLARHEEISKTIVYKKDAALVKGVEVAGGATWDQSPNPYNAAYPFNHVSMTESGHVLEFDDSPHSERIHLYHKSGTFMEIDANGTQVTRIVGDGYEIYERNGYVQINGSLNVTVDGASNILVKNGLNLDVRGVANINVYNDVNLNVSGSLNASVSESFKLKAAQVIIEGNSVDIRSNGALTMSGTGNININSGGTLHADGSLVNIANGASNASVSGLAAPATKQTPSMPEFNQLTVIGRSAGEAGQYETPEEGDPTKFQQKQINSGAIKSEEINTGTQTEAVEAPANNITPPGANCDIIMMKQTFEPSFVLSTNYKLSALTSNGSRMPVAQQGLSAQTIVCNLKGLCENYLEIVRNLYPNLIITSAFRRPGDVAASSKTSDHYLGLAVDIVIPSIGRQGHYDAIKKIQQLVPYDQLILEYQGATTVWIHGSFRYSGARKQIFTMRDHHRIGDMGQFILVA